MKSFTIYLRESTDPINDAVYLSENFSYKALFFNLFWLIYHRLWMPAIAFSLMAIGILELTQAFIISPTVSFALFVFIGLYIGFNAKDYLRARLEREGYSLVDILVAKSVDEAEFKFISRFMAHQAKLDEDKSKTPVKQ
jgi:hypothetical protein